MSRLPSLDEYNGVVQNPKTAFTDPLLQTGKISSDNNGLPIPTSGGFAVTYELTRANQRYAVRVFHKDSPDLQKRYAAISQALASIKSPYFVDFQFQNQGIRVNGALHPIVRMDWIDGDTLGNYLESNFRNRSAMERLRAEVIGAGNLLDQYKIAHGDLQTGNILVTNNRIRLIDYDGMFVQNLATMSASELGHRHFQHPGRTAKHFNPHLDRFSLIVLDLSLDVVAQSPDLFAKYGTTGDNILFTANDYSSPESSEVFAELYRNSNHRTKAERLAALCKTDFEKIPSLEEFKSGRWMPSVSVTPRASYNEPSAGFIEVVRDVFYQGNVLDATNYSKALTKIGDRVELIGQVTEIKALASKYGKSYLVFINFGDWRGSILKASIRGNRAQKLRDSLDSSWVGQWVSVMGMLEPVYSNPKYKYHHIAITVSESSQLHRISADEAQFRLGTPKKVKALVAAPTPQAPVRQSGTPSNGNQRILDELNRSNYTPVSPSATSTWTPPPPKPTPPAALPKSRNQQLLAQLGPSGTTGAAPMNSAQAQPTTPKMSQPSVKPAVTPSTPPSTNKGYGCLILVLIAIGLIVLMNRK